MKDGMEVDDDLRDSTSLASSCPIASLKDQLDATTHDVVNAGEKGDAQEHAVKRVFASTRVQTAEPTT